MTASAPSHARPITPADLNLVRRCRGIRLVDLADEAGLTIGALSRFLNGKLQLRPESEARIYRALFGTPE